MRRSISFLAAIAASGVAMAQKWEPLYGADVMPAAATPAWVQSNLVTGLNGPAVSTIEDDPEKPGNKIYHYKAPMGSRHMWKVSCPPGTKTMTLVARVKMPNDTVGLGMSFDLQLSHVRERMFVGNLTGSSNANVRIRHANGGQYVPVPNITTWNTYRLTLNADSTVNFYLNENNTPLVTGVSVDSAVENQFRFGQSFIDSHSESLMDWIIYDFTGAYSPSESPLPEGMQVDVSNVRFFGGQSGYQLARSPGLNYLNRPVGLYNISGEKILPRGNYDASLQKLASGKYVGYAFGRRGTIGLLK